MVRALVCAAIAGVMAVGATAWAQGGSADAKHKESHAQPAAAPKHNDKGQDGGHHANGTAASPAAAAFERLKALAAGGGEWKGKGTHGEDSMEATVRYTLTAGGSALVEHQFPGSEHEMTTIYTLDGDAIAVTHYCMLGNQPRMLAKPGGEAKELMFECVSVGNCASEDAPAMRSLHVTFDGPDKISQQWGMHEKGACISTAKFELERVKAQAAPTYYVVFVKFGPKWNAIGSPEQQRLIEQHKQFIDGQREKGIVKAAGPFVDGFGGMTVLTAADADAALALAKEDPAVAAGLFEVSVHPWLVKAGKVE